MLALASIDNTPEYEKPAQDEFLRPDDMPAPLPRRLSNQDQEPISPQEHSFVKTTFGKRMWIPFLEAGFIIDSIYL